MSRPNLSVGETLKFPHTPRLWRQEDSRGPPLPTAFPSSPRRCGVPFKERPLQRLSPRRLLHTPCSLGLDGCDPRRLAKEKMMYEKEAKQQEEKIEKMKAEDSENYALKKQAEILQESRMMIPDCQRRLEAAYTDLLQILENEKELEEAEEYKEARLVLDSVKLEV
ncbi:Tubulin-specific chaperone A [Myotis brandtii]|uniref:Tubulin-specific chaperone A n=1 Tax=Myotis brandtii TaxID=109478 RepID=S7ME85_MYOBR|nr:Tubulin-specific chaperone A [Myotis brandtii]